MKKIAVYGSLRKGGWLHEGWISNNKAKELGTYTIPGFEIYPITGNFPAACEKENSNIVVDVFEIEDVVFINLSEMEERAGYRPIEISIKINKEEHLFFMYIMSKETMKSFWNMNDSTKPISDGDWINFIKKQ